MERGRVEFPAGAGFRAVPDGGPRAAAFTAGARQRPASCNLPSARGPAGNLRSEVKRLTRAQAIDGLRKALTALTDDDTCMCLAAARLGIYCKGFAQWKSYELKERYEWIARNRRGITRRELEELANRWQLARQQVRGTELSCDTQSLEHHTCRGWDGFSDAELAAFHAELCGEPVEIEASAAAT